MHVLKPSPRSSDQTKQNEPQPNGKGKPAKDEHLTKGGDVKGGCKGGTPSKGAAVQKGEASSKDAKPSTAERGHWEAGKGRGDASLPNGCMPASTGSPKGDQPTKGELAQKGKDGTKGGKSTKGQTAQKGKDGTKGGKSTKGQAAQKGKDGTKGGKSNPPTQVSQAKGGDAICTPPAKVRAASSSPSLTPTTPTTPASSAASKGGSKKGEGKPSKGKAASKGAEHGKKRPCEEAPVRNVARKVSFADEVSAGHSYVLSVLP